MNEFDIATMSIWFSRQYEKDIEERLAHVMYNSNIRMLMNVLNVSYDDIIDMMTNRIYVIQHNDARKFPEKSRNAGISSGYF